MDSSGMPASVAGLISRVRDESARSQLPILLSRWSKGCDARAAWEASQIAKAAIDRDSSDYWARAIHGILLLRGPQVQIPNAAGLIYRPILRHTNSASEGQQALAAAVEQTGSVAAAEELVLYVTADHGKVGLKSAKATLYRMAKLHPSPRIHALIAQIEIELGDYAAAAAASAVGVAQDDAAAYRAFAIAHMLSRTRLPAAAASYLRGLEQSDGITLSMYYDDLRLLTTPAEDSAWNALPDSAKRSWIREAWEWRASISTLSVPERLTEHFRRVAYARVHYTKQSYRGARPFDSLWSQEFSNVSLFDDRGTVYIRHGAPDDLATYSSPGIIRTAWLYRQFAGGRAVLEFAKDPYWSDYYLPDPTAACDEPIKGGGNVHYELFARQNAQRDALRRYTDHIAGFLHWNANKTPPRRVLCYGTLAGDTHVDGALSGYALRNVVGPALYHRETAYPRLTRGLPAVLNSYAFRASGGTEIISQVSVPTEEVSYDKRPGDSVSVSFRVFSSLEDSSTHTVFRHDSVVTVQLTQPAVGAVRFTSSVVYPDPPSTLNVRLGLFNRSDTLQGQILSLVRGIPRYTNSKFALSDLVIASQTGNGALARRGVLVDPIPGHRVVTASEFTLLYEQYGTHDGDELTVEISIAPVGKAGMLQSIQELIRKREAIRITFNERIANPDGDVALSTRTISTGGLKEGTYRLTLTATSLRTGGTAASSTELIVTNGR